MASGREMAGVRALPRLAWAPVIAGVLLALAAHVVLGLIGAALGLAAEPADSRALGALAGFWGLLTPLAATLLGAWLACRLAATEDVRATNLHGVMVWAIGIVAGALFLTGTAASGAMGAGSAMAGGLGRIVGDVARQDSAAGAAARVAGAGAMAGLAGLLGAFAGAALARTRWKAGGLGWRIALQRTAGERPRVETARADGGTYAEPGRAASVSAEEAREVERSEGPGAPGPYHH